MDLPEGGWGYCTEFLIEGNNLDVERIRTQIEALGNSVLVVGEPELVKVHVHTDDPTRVIALAGGYGKLLKLNVGDMSTQHRRILESEAGGDRDGRAARQRCRAGRRGRRQGPGRHLQGAWRRRHRRGRPDAEPEHAGHAAALSSRCPTTRSSCSPTTRNVILAAKQVAGADQARTSTSSRRTACRRASRRSSRSARTSRSRRTSRR